MLVVLPILCWLVIWFIRESRVNCWRQAFIESSIIWAVCAVSMIEILSLVTAFTQTAVAISWSLILVGASVLALRLGSFSKLAEFSKIASLRTSLPSPLFPILVGAAFIVATLGVIAVYCPPNNYDSMAYHLSRIEHWIKNQSVAHFQIHSLRQLTQNPCAEFLIMQLRILSGADYFSDAVQWFSMVGCLIGTSLLAKQFGADERGQVLASILCLTIPVGILESTSTQNDYVGAFWFVCFLLNVKQVGAKAIWLGLSLGLFLLTKQTAYIFTLPFLALASISAIKQNTASGFRSILVVVVLAAALFAPFAIRNTMRFGTPIVSKAIFESGYTPNNDSYEPKYFLSNVMRNFADEAFAPIPAYNKALVSLIEKVHVLFHWDVNDPKSTYEGTVFAPMHPAFQLHEDIAGAPLHTLLFIIAAALAIASKKMEQRRVLLLFGSALIVGFLLFSVGVKWSPWHSRLLLPLYVAGCVFAGCVLTHIPRKLSAALMVVLLVYALPYVVMNPNKFLLGDENIFVTPRDVNYFRGAPNIYTAYATARDFFDKNHASTVGVVADDISWSEYPLWIMLTHGFSKPATVEGLSASEWKDYNRQTPDALISFGRRSPETISIPAMTYRRSLVCDSQEDRITYHFFGHAIGHSYSHLIMAIYLPVNSEHIVQASRCN
jgi:hypothetical protein